MVLCAGAANFGFKKVQLTISLEAEKVRSTETSDDGVEGLVGQELTFDTDPFVERTPQFRLKEKDVTMSPDFARSAKVGEGQATLHTLHASFPLQLDVDISVRNKLVGTLQLEVTYQNNDLEQVVDDGLNGKTHGFKNFTVDGDSVAVQSAAVEWANCLKHAIHVVNYTLTSTDIGFCCTVWYKVNADKLHELKELVQAQKRHIAERRGSSPTVSKKSPQPKSPRSPTHKKASSKRRESNASTKDVKADE
jgi:hypothetical protein